MTDFMFRNLEADEIEVRVSEVRENGLTLLLYKNARCDMAILDEAMTPMGWQREHYECKGNLFCRVGLLGDGGWVWKSDAGKESNFESEKGEASDSFKRACTNWGIGRELYTAPRIWVPAGKANIKRNNNGKVVCYDKFSIAKAIIEQHVIQCVAVRNNSTGRIVFTWIRPGYEVRKPEPAVSIESPDGVTTRVPVFQDDAERMAFVEEVVNRERPDFPPSMQGNQDNQGWESF